MKKTNKKKKGKAAAQSLCKRRRFQLLRLMEPSPFISSLGGDFGFLGTGIVNLSTSCGAK
ncbi:hypothetical protein SCA6_011401 [Theobroma cacao]